MVINNEELLRQLEGYSTDQLLAVLAQRIRTTPVVRTETLGLLRLLTEQAKQKVPKDTSPMTPQKTVATPARIERQMVEADRSGYWAEVLRTQGTGCLEGKFNENWMVNGKPIGRVYTGFRSVGAFGSQSIEDISYYAPAHQIAGEAYGTYELPEDNRNSANYFATAPVDTKADTVLVTKLGLKGQWSSGCYLSWASKYNPQLPDHRGHHLPVRLSFLLPATQMAVLTNEIKANPDLIEDIFQRMYPDLNKEHGFTRVATRELRLMEVGLGTPTGPSVQRDLIRNPTKLNFSRIIGETPVRIEQH